MKQLFLALAFFACIISSCKKSGDPGTSEDLYKDVPRGNLPAELAPANWRYGSVSALGIYDNRGNHMANAQDALREYEVNQDGFIEFVQYLATNSGSCYSMAYTHLKGAMKWEAPNKIIWTPVEGEFESRFTCGGTQSIRKATKADLERIKSIYWYKWDDFGTGGKSYLVLYTDPSLQEQYKAFAYDVIK